MNLWGKVKYAVFGDKPDKKTGLTPIEQAARDGRVEDVMYYQQHGANENPRGRYFLERAEASMDTLKGLMDNNVIPRGGRQVANAIRSAMFSDLESLTPDNIKLCRLLGVSMGSKMPDGTTFMTQRRSPEQKEMWMKHARPEQMDAEFQSAAKRDDLETMKTLYATGKVKVDAINKDGQSAFWLASNGGHLKAASYLADLGARMDIKDKKGYSAFATPQGNQVSFGLAQKFVRENNVKRTNDVLSINSKAKASYLLHDAHSPEMVENLCVQGVPYADVLSELEGADKRRDEATPPEYAWKMDLLRGFFCEECRKREAANAPTIIPPSLRDAGR